MWEPPSSLAEPARLGCILTSRLRRSVRHLPVPPASPGWIAYFFYFTLPYQRLLPPLSFSIKLFSPLVSFSLFLPPSLSLSLLSSLMCLISPSSPPQRPVRCPRQAKNHRFTSQHIRLTRSAPHAAQPENQRQPKRITVRRKKFCEITKPFAEWNTAHFENNIIAKMWLRCYHLWLCFLLGLAI